MKSKANVTYSIILVLEQKGDPIIVVIRGKKVSTQTWRVYFLSTVVERMNNTSNIISNTVYYSTVHVHAAVKSALLLSSIEKPGHGWDKCPITRLALF